MKSLILVSALLVGFSASAEVCTVSKETADRIKYVNNSGMMAKPKYTTIRALVGEDACMAQYLNEGDAANLAREIMNLKMIPAEQILNGFVSNEAAKMASAEPQSCEASEQTIAIAKELSQVKGASVKPAYVSLKGTLASDECISSTLSQAEVTALAQQIMFEANDTDSVELMISMSLTK